MADEVNKSTTWIVTAQPISVPIPADPLLKSNGAVYRTHAIPAALRTISDQMSAEADELIKFNTFWRFIALLIFGAGIGLSTYKPALKYLNQYLVEYWISLFFFGTVVSAQFIRKYFYHRLKYIKEWTDISWNLLAVSGIASLISKSTGLSDLPTLLPAESLTGYLLLLASTASLRAAVAIVTRFKPKSKPVALAQH